MKVLDRIICFHIGYDKRHRYAERAVSFTLFTHAEVLNPQENTPERCVR